MSQSKRAAVSEEAAAALKEKLKDGHWTASTNSDGYPKVKIDGESRLATHVLLEMKGRPVKPGQVVMHRDNDLRNLSLDNLRVGTQQQNLKQMRDEGRDRPRGVDQEPDVKTAAPSWVKQIRATLGSGDLAGAQGIASRMNAAKTRLVKPLSIGGQEAAAGLTAGASLAGPTPTGLQVRKFYKPDSFVANRDAMTKVLEHKQDAITTARGLSPEARAMVPDMYGSKALHEGAKTRHISDHEYVHGLRDMTPAETATHAGKLHQQVVAPLHMQGRTIGDVPRPHHQSEYGFVGNSSNLVADAQGAPKMVDFLPHGRGTPVRMNDAGAVLSMDQSTGTSFNAARGSQGWGGLMKEVHQPQTEFPATTHFRPDSSWGQPIALPPQMTMPASTSAGGGTYTATPVVHHATYPATQMTLNKTGAATTVPSLSLRKKADAIDQMGMPGVQDMYQRFAPRTRYQVAQLGSRIGINSPLAAFQNLHMDASARGVPFMQHVNSMAEQQGIQAGHLRATPMPRPAPLDIDVDAAFKAPTPAPAAPMPAMPTSSAQMVGPPRPRAGVMPSAAPVDSRLLRTTPAAGVPAVRPPVPAAPMPQLPTVPRPRMPSMPRLGAMLHK